VTICLGSDAAPESNFNDMFRVMYCLGAHRDAKLDASLLPPELMLEMCIVNGARALAWEREIGSLAAGMKADLILVNTLEPEWVPLHNPISNLVFSATGRSVDTVMIDGVLVMADRRLTQLDEEAILREAQERAEAIARRAGIDHYGRPYWPLIE
jgi:5-methylthioadenosine/S-adenosylhomocysteine deaminase